MPNIVDQINVGGINFDVRDTLTRDIVANTESTNYASRAYAKDELFIWTDGKVYRTLAAIQKDEQFVLETNVHLENTIGKGVSGIAESINNSFRSDDKRLLYDIPSYPWEVASYDYPDNILTHMQGGCILPDGYIVQYLVDSNDTQGALVLFDDSGVFYSQTAANLTHGNDMCWSNKFNRLIITTGSSENNLMLYQYSDSAFTYDRTIEVPSPMKVHGIVEVGDYFYIYNNSDNSLYKTNDFINFELLNSNFTQLSTGGLSFYRQGIASDGEYIYYVGKLNFTGHLFSFINAYDLEGRYKDSVSYPEGWGEVEWIDFRDGFMYTATYTTDITTNGTLLFRKDKYRSVNNGCYPTPTIWSGGITGVQYVHLNSTWSGGFSNGRLATKPFKHGKLACKCMAGMSQFAIRSDADNTEIVLQNFTGTIRDAFTDKITKIDLERCNITTWGGSVMKATTIKLTDCNFSGNLTGTVTMNRTNFRGVLNGTASGNNNIATCAISGNNNITP